MRAAKAGFLFLAVAVLVTGSGWAATKTIHETYPLAPGALIEISSINGKVTVESVEGDVAELEIVRTARYEESFGERPVVIDHDEGRLVIRVDNRERRSRDNPRDELTLYLPAHAGEMLVHGVNGSVSVGYIEGASEVRGVNGPVNLRQGSGELRVSGVNGRVRLALGALSEDGIEIKGVNGRIQIDFDEDPNADLDVNGKNGDVDLDLSHVNVTHSSRKKFRATIGSGGTPINIKGVNGSIRLTAGR